MRNLLFFNLGFFMVHIKIQSFCLSHHIQKHLLYSLITCKTLKKIINIPIFDKIVNILVVNLRLNINVKSNKFELFNHHHILNNVFIYNLTQYHPFWTVYVQPLYELFFFFSIEISKYFL